MLSSIILFFLYLKFNICPVKNKKEIFSNQKRIIKPKSTIMKKIILALSLGILFASCSTDSTETEINTIANSTAKVSTAKTLITTAAVLPATNYTLSAYENCTTNCISEGSATYFEQTAQQTVSWGGPNNDKFSKTVYIKYFNTLTDFKILVLSTNDFSDLIINNTSTGISAASNTWAEYSLPLETTWNACDTKNFKIQVSGNGPQANFEINYNLIGQCLSSCETTFTGKAIACGSAREAEYTFTSKEDVSNLKIQGGLTNFTGTNAVVTITGGNLTQSQKTPGGSSNRVITIEGSVKACEKITINIKWNSTNSGGIITGQWSASATNLSINPIVGLECQN